MAGWAFWQKGANAGGNGRVPMHMPKKALVNTTAKKMPANAHVKKELKQPSEQPWHLTLSALRCRGEVVWSRNVESNRDGAGSEGRLCGEVVLLMSQRQTYFPSGEDAGLCCSSSEDM